MPAQPSTMAPLWSARQRLAAGRLDLRQRVARHRLERQHRNVGAVHAAAAALEAVALQQPLGDHAGARHRRHHREASWPASRRHGTPPRRCRAPARRRPRGQRRRPGSPKQAITTRVGHGARPVRTCSATPAAATPRRKWPSIDTGPNVGWHACICGASCRHRARGARRSRAVIDAVVLGLINSRWVIVVLWRCASTSSIVRRRCVVSGVGACAPMHQRCIGSNASSGPGAARARARAQWHALCIPAR